MFPEQFDFYPQTWLMPYEAKKLRKEWDHIVEHVDPNFVLIVKPEASC